MTNTRQELAKAFELIKKDQLDDAIIIVKPITEREPNNADGWWLLANASSEPRDARRALVQTLKINPTYPKARDLLDKLNELYPPRDDELMMMMAIEDVEQPIPTGDDDFFEDDGGYGELDDLDALFTQADDSAEDDFSDPFSAPAPAETAKPEKSTKLPKKKAATDDEDFQAYPEHENPFEKMLESPEMLSGQQTKTERSGLPIRRILIFGLAAILILAVLGLVLTMLISGDDGEEATRSYADRAPVEAAALNADQADTLESQRANIEGGVRAQFDRNATVVFMESDGDYLLMAEMCSRPSPRLPRLVQDTMGLLAVNLNTAEALREAVALVGVEISDCNNPDDKIYTALAPIGAVNTLNSSSPLDRAEAFRTFQATWIISNN